MTPHLLLKRKLAQLAAAMRTSVTSNSRVLLYHSVGGGPDSLGILPFREQIATSSRIAKIVDLPTALASQTCGAVAITFDDGYASVADNAAHILSEFGATATIYLNTGWIGRHRGITSRSDLGHLRDETFLTWDAILKLRETGWCIGSHGVEHVDFTRVDLHQTRDQLAQSRSQIEAVLKEPCSHFAYTWGRHNADVRAAVAEVGYKFAGAGHHSSLGPQFDPLAFPRINVSNDWTLDDFNAVLRGDWDYLGWIQRGRLWLHNALGA